MRENRAPSNLKHSTPTIRCRERRCFAIRRRLSSLSSQLRIFNGGLIPICGCVAFGRAMLATQHLAFRDPYSYSAPGHLWLNHEWLSELLMAVIYNSGGVIGLKVLKFACTSVVVLLLALGLAKPIHRRQFRSRFFSPQLSRSRRGGRGCSALILPVSLWQ